VAEPKIGPDGFYQFPFVDQELGRYFQAKRTNAGYVNVRIEAECTPYKRDPQWHQDQIALMGLKEYRREHRLDWTAAAGEVYYPEFANDPTPFVDPTLAFTKGQPVYRGWDFGIRHPACVWAQVIGGELRVLREVLPSNIDPYSWCKLVMYLSGEIAKDTLEQYPRALSWALRIEGEDPTKWRDKEYTYPKPPWFPEGTRFVDYAGPECYTPSTVLEKEHEFRNDYEILASNGIHLGVLYTRVAARCAVLRKLFLPISSGGPRRFKISPHCRDTAAGLAGGISYKKESLHDPEPNEPQKDGWYEHLHDALGYLAVNLVSVVEESAPTPEPGPFREDSEIAAAQAGHESLWDERITSDPEEDW
jgi:hypothetical protein